MLLYDFIDQGSLLDQKPRRPRKIGRYFIRNITSHPGDPALSRDKVGDGNHHRF